MVKEVAPGPHKIYHLFWKAGEGIPIPNQMCDEEWGEKRACIVTLMALNCFFGMSLFLTWNATTFPPTPTFHVKLPSSLRR